MQEFRLTTPVLLVGFTRFETAQKVFDEIRKAKPRQFFLAVDGPREGRPDDVERCNKTKQIAAQVDWECEVYTLFQEKNLGCGVGTTRAIDWMFEHVEEGIIFDDDCVPDQSFFRFCQELLQYYKHDARVMHISGDNFQMGKKRGDASYYFSRYTHNWGWATWRRAWKHNDFKMLPPEARRHIWDKQWLKSVEREGGLAISPNVNLITNIGDGPGATHTEGESPLMNLPRHRMPFPLVHPAHMRSHIRADFFTYTMVFNGTIRARFLYYLLKLIPPPIKKRIKLVWKRIPQK